MGSFQRPIWLFFLCIAGTIAGDDYKPGSLWFHPSGLTEHDKRVWRLFWQSAIYTGTGQSCACHGCLRDWNVLKITTEDMTADLGAGALSGRGGNCCIYARSFLNDHGPTQHLLGNVLIDVQVDTASSRAYVSDMHLGRVTGQA